MRGEKDEKMRIALRETVEDDLFLFFYPRTKRIVKSRGNYWEMLANAWNIRTGREEKCKLTFSPAGINNTEPGRIFSEEAVSASPSMINKILAVLRGLKSKDSISVGTCSGF